MTSTTWTQNAGMDSGTDSDGVVTYAEAAQAAAEAAAASEAAAAASESDAETAANSATTSKNASASSATAAAASASAASSSASTATAAATAAASSAATAAAAATETGSDVTAAETAAVNAASSAVNAGVAETNAASSATSAASSATSANASYISAASSAVVAEGHKDAAAASATEASGYVTDASDEVALAAAQASNAASSATAAATSETNAATSETNAAASAATATTKASEASVSATAAATSETNALSYVADTEAARDQSQDARDTANLHKLAAEAAATSATNTAAALTGFDLEAIAESKAVTAVDVFVYDTSKDSDGGAWRKRTQGTSWYNETLNTATRGSRREFPAVAVIVAEAAKVTIYDGDDPSLPMWMVFNVFITYSQSMITAGNPPSTLALSFLNGIMAVGSQNGTAGNTGANGLFRVDFISDTGRKTNGAVDKLFGAGIDKRNATGFVNYLTDPNISSARLAGTSINDVAMTVLPNAPIDAATGLPVPTIAVATDGGLSVITDSGAVYDATPDSYAWWSVAFREEDNAIVGTRFPNGRAYVITVYNTPFTADRTDYDEQYNRLGDGLGSDGLWIGNVPSTPNTVRVANDGKSFRTLEHGFFQFAPNPNTPSDWLNAQVTSTYNTGWMNGDIKGAFLSDTDDTDLVGSGELVTNGTFDTDAGWDVSDTGVQIANGRVEHLLTNDYSLIVGNFTLTAGVRYWVGVTANSYINLKSGTWSNGFVQMFGKAGIFITPSVTGLFAIEMYYGGTTVDNLSVRVTDEDRSVNANPLTVNGTVTRSPVATGADLVAYSGFSASNYLEQPYNSGLDFGTGDFCIMGWVKYSGNNQRTILSRENAAGTYAIYLMASALTVTFRLAGGSAVSTPTGSLPSNVWSHVCALRRSGVLYVYINGVLSASAAGAGSVTLADAVLKVGQYYTPSPQAFGDPLALLRISATAPSATQIAKIYEDEKVLFQENAGAVLAGTSDAVTALAYDDDTQELLVGTSQNTSVFRGLRRVETISGSASAISASNGLRVIED